MQYTRWLGIDISGLIVDFSLWLLSIHLIWGLQMKLSKRIFVLMAFAVRLVWVSPNIKQQKVTNRKQLDTGTRFPLTIPASLEKYRPQYIDHCSKHIHRGGHTVLHHGVLCNIP